MKKVVLYVVLSFLLTTFGYTQNFWRQTNGTYGGTINSLAINSSGNVFAGTDGGGVYRSTDNGNNWNQINTDLKTSRVYALVINSSGYICS